MSSTIYYTLKVNGSRILSATSNVWQAKGVATRGSSFVINGLTDVTIVRTVHVGVNTVAIEAISELPTTPYERVLRPSPPPVNLSGEA